MHQLQFREIRVITISNTLKSLATLVIFASYISGVQAQKSIIPDIHAKGQRGEIARKMQSKSTNQFLRADTNHNYLISSEEAAEHLIYISRKFSHYDKNKDNSLSWSEFLGHNKWPAPVHK